MKANFFWILALLCIGMIRCDVAHALPIDTVRIVRCEFRVDGKIYISGPCEYRYSENQVEFGQKRPENYYRYFGFIDYRNANKTVGEGTWNGPDIHSMHGDNFLGLMSRHGACWSNERARLCVLRSPGHR